METFDSIQIYRPELAKSYIQLLQAQPGRPIALFAPRRVGKTFFLDQDLSPEAKRAGYVVIYADVWLHRTSPLDAINHVLEETLDDLTIPKSSVGRGAKTPVKKLGGLGASLEFGEEPERRALPLQAELRLDALVARIYQTAGKPLLLMLDEIQSLVDHDHGHSIIATLRAVLQRHKQKVFAVFTGSSQEALSEMMAAAGGPMYQFAQLLDFPVLGEDYLQLLADHFEKVHSGKRLDLGSLKEVFERIGFKPALMKDLVKDMSAEGSTDIEFALKRMMQDDRQVAGWQALLSNMKPLEKMLLAQIATGNPPLGKETLIELEQQGMNPTISKIRSALGQLRRKGIITHVKGSYMIEDRLFA